MKSKKIDVFPKIALLNKHIFAPLVILTYGTITIEAVTHPSFLANATGLSANFYLFTTIISFLILFIDYFFYDHKFSKETDIVLRLNTVLLPFSVLVLYLFNQLEKINYPNYVFATFHIHISKIQTIVLFGFLISFIYLAEFVFKTIKKRLPKLAKPKNGKPNYQQYRQYIGPFSFFVCITFVTAAQLYEVGGKISENAANILRQPFVSMEERRQFKFGQSYQVYQFLRDNSEESDIINVPSQSEWGIIGNIGFSRYFVYPTTLIHAHDYHREEDVPDFEYYIIALSKEQPDGTYDIWPREAIEAEYIILFDPMTNETEHIETTLYDPVDPQFKDHWGLIRVKR